MATKAEIRDRAAHDLGILELNQNLQSQDDTRISDAYDEVYAALKRKGQATWASTGSVPDELTPHVAALVAENCLSTYAVSQARFARIKEAARLAGLEIPELTASYYNDYTEAVDY
ncbi:MAG: hypothetical protein GWN13_21115 [Phycisphaerae bacterium]|nr:hypothetical protein [Phycisphaerae bacterium]